MSDSFFNRTVEKKDILQTLRELIGERYASLSEKALYQVYMLDRDLQILPEETVEFLQAERKTITQILQDELNGSLPPDKALVPFFLRRTKAFVFHHNQFINYSAQDEKVLRAIYTQLLRNILRLLGQERSLEEWQDLLFRHHLALRAFTASFLEQTPNLPDERQTIFQTPVCEEYSNTLQLALLAIDESQLQEPILDIGCGQEGRLVHYLHRQGLGVYGIDRVCDSSPFLWERDWFRFRFEPDSWGSILSHMAFSNHFLFHHLHSSGSPERYAAEFMAILSSLRKGGSFYYTPGLPFIEPFLPDSLYRITKTPVSLPSAFQPEFHGMDVFYSVRIQKK